MSEQPPSEPAPVEAPVSAVPRSPGSGLPTSTVVVGAILIAVLGFGAGFVAGHRSARQASPFARYGHMGAVPWMRSGEMPGIGLPASGGYGGVTGTMPGLPSVDRILAGIVTDARGDSFTLRTLRGETVTVMTTSSTIVRGMSGGTLEPLQPGQWVLVAGAPQADGSIAATHVLEGAMGSLASPVPGSSTSTANG